jgi:hypothetical protein
VRFLEENRGLVIGVVAALIAWACIRHFVTGRLEAEAAAVRSEVELRTRELAKMAPSAGLSVEQAQADAEKESARLARARAELKVLEFELEPAFQPADVAQPKLYFEEQLARVREEARASSVSYKNQVTPLGFTAELISKEKVPDLLRRLALASHFKRCAAEAGIDSVLAASHGEVVYHSTEGSPVVLSEYPMTVTVLANERSLMWLLHNLQKRKRCAPVQKLAISVTKAASGTFEATVVFAAEFMAEKASTEPKPKDGPYPKLGADPGNY